jgi:hypothetical protein
MLNSTAARVALIGSIAVCMLIIGCRQDAPPVATRSLPGGGGFLELSPFGKGPLTPGIDYCSYFASSLSKNGGPFPHDDEFTFFFWGDFWGGGGGTMSVTKDGLKFSGNVTDHQGDRRLELAGATKDGKTGQVTIDYKAYDLADGTLFLVSARRGYNVKQLKRDLTRFQDAKELFVDLGKNDAEVQEFFAKAVYP